MTPLLDRLERYAGKQPARFHMPGHKGRLPPPLDTAAPWDVTELSATADLYQDSDGALRDSEQRMAALYGEEDCLYLTGGATQGLQTALSALTSVGDTIWVDRICHKAVYHAMALLDLRPVYLRRSLLSPFGITDGFDALPTGKAAACVYTDPSYYGLLSPPPATPKGMPRIRDAAHGGALPFFGLWQPRRDTLTVVSAHKTLPALGQTAFLLSDGTVEHRELRERAQIFGTASPSFLLLASLDMAQARLHKTGAGDWAGIQRFSTEITERHSNILSPRHTPHFVDPAKLCVYTGRGTADALRLEEENAIVCEMADSRNLVFMLSPGNSGEELERLAKALQGIEALPSAPPMPPPLPPMAATPREALLGASELVPLHKAAGRIAAQVVGFTPPGSPLAAPGERFDKITLDFCIHMCYNDKKPVRVLR